MGGLVAAEAMIRYAPPSLPPSLLPFSSPHWFTRPSLPPSLPPFFPLYRGDKRIARMIAVGVPFH